MNKYAYIEELKADTNQIIAICEQEFLTESHDLLESNPEPNSWSVSECMRHLLIANQHYLDRLFMAFDKHTPKPGDKPFKPGFFGELFTKMMKPRGEFIPRPMTTIRRFEPTYAHKKGYQVLRGKEAVQTLIEQQQMWLDMLETAKDYDWRIRITSAVGPLVRFKMGDAMRFMTAHTQRHIVQAQHALQVVRS